ncbi:MAG: DNA pilot protein [Microvirus sp.]|nr:MAG: DNA pilot protein [Microvirus sp.]
MGAEDQQLGMGNWVGALGGAASGAIGMGVQRLGVNYDYRKQREQSKKLMEMGIVGQGQLMDIQNAKQLEQWKKTGPVGQVEQLKLAGLNPALMYGGGGGGGQTMGAGMPSVSAPVAQDPQTRHGADGAQGMGMQMALLEAQRQALLAGANKDNADANKTNGIDTALGNETLTGIHLDNVWKQNTMQDRIDTVKTEFAIKLNNLSQEQVKTNVSEATRGAQIEQVKADAVKASVGIALLEAQTKESKSNVKVNEQQIENMKKDLQVKDEQIKTWVNNNMLGWEQLSVEQRKARVMELNNDWNTNENKYIMDKVFGVVDGIMSRQILPAAPRGQAHGSNYNTSGNSTGTSKYK